MSRYTTPGMNTKHVLKEGGEVAIALLKLASASADILPPLKSAASSALYIADMVAVCYRADYHGCAI
jgi:hypothetical protein